MLAFGDFEEGSRAVPTDIDFDEGRFKLVSRLSDKGRRNLQDLEEAREPFTVCIFNGSTSQSLAEAFIKSVGSEAALLSETFLEESKEVGGLDPVFGSRSPGRRQVLSLHQVGSVLLFVVDQEQLGRVFYHQLLDQEVSPLVKDAKIVYIFHTDPHSNFRSNNEPGSLYYLKSSVFGSRDLSLYSGILNQLPQPNIVENFSAAALIHCEMINKACLLVVNYTEFSDTLSHVPFLRFIEATPALKNILKLSPDLALRTKTNNSVLYNSNLFI